MSKTNSRLAYVRKSVSKLACFILLLIAPGVTPSLLAARKAVFNVKDYGATGEKTDDARPAIQKTINACAAAGGGTVYIPPGQYTSGTLHLRSHVRFQLAAGATLFADPEPNAYDCGPNPSKAALFYGEDLEDISFTGQGVVDGQAEYEWKPDDFEKNFGHKILMEKLGQSVMRSFPKDFPKRQLFPHMIWLGRSKGIKVTGLNFLHSPSWTITLYACKRAVFEGLYIYTSLKEAVWADGIDLDGCNDVSIANCTIETGDDCVALISHEGWGPALPCENITITNCRLSSASTGVKLTEGNKAGVRHVRISNTVFNNVNRGIFLNTALGGDITDVTLSNLTINCNRFEWFWSGDAQPFRVQTTRLSELNDEPAQPDERPPGSIRNITIRNVVARAKGSCFFYGHAENWLDSITLENVKLFLSSDPSAPFDLAEHALDLRRIRNLKVKNVEVFWEKPGLEAWKSAIYLEDINGLELDGFAGREAWPNRDAPVLVLNQVSKATVRNCRALDGAEIFLKIMGPASRDIRLQSNDFGKAKVPCQIGQGVPPGEVKGLEAIRRN